MKGHDHDTTWAHKVKDKAPLLRDLDVVCTLYLQKLQNNQREKHENHYHCLQSNL